MILSSDRELFNDLKDLAPVIGDRVCLRKVLEDLILFCNVCYFIAVHCGCMYVCVGEGTALYMVLAFCVTHL